MSSKKQMLNKTCKALTGNKWTSEGKCIAEGGSLEELSNCSVNLIPDAGKEESWVAESQTTIQEGSLDTRRPQLKVVRGFQCLPGQGLISVRNSLSEACFSAQIRRQNSQLLQLEPLSELCYLILEVCMLSLSSNFPLSPFLSLLLIT